MEKGMKKNSNRNATRNYTALAEGRWSLWETIYARRSCRKYSPAVPETGFIDSLQELASSALGVRRAGLKSVMVTAPEDADEIRKRVYKGLSGKINLWLSRAPVTGFLVMSVPFQDLEADRPLELPTASMAAQDCILWLTERGWGTCWLGGVSSREVGRFLGIDGSMTIPAVICYGRPRGKPGSLSYDRFAEVTLSRRRKPMQSVACIEAAGEAFIPADEIEGPVRVSSRQDVASLLQAMTEGDDKAGAPLDTALEACLEAARVAPSGGNAQRWRFVAVKEPDRVSRLEQMAGGGTAGGSTDGRGWKAALVAAGTEKAIETSLLDKPFWVIDVPIAISHMSLMAASMGFRAEVRVRSVDEEAVNSFVELPEGERTVGVLGLA